MELRGSGHAVLLAAVGAATVLACVPGWPLRAQDVTRESPYSGGSLLDRPTLTGDWGGAREALARQGISVRSSLTQFYQGPTAGNVKHVFNYGGRLDLFLDLDGEKLGLWDGFSIHVLGEYNFGRTPGLVGGTTIPNSTALTFPYGNQAGGDLTSVFFAQRFGSNFTLMAGKMSMFDFYARGHRFSGGRGIEGFWNTAFVGPPSGIVPVAAFGAVGTLKIDPLSITMMVYDPNDALNRTGFEQPFSKGVTFRGSLDLSSRLAGLPRTDSFMAAISSEPGPDFASAPGLIGLGTPEVRRDLVRQLTTDALWGTAARVPGLDEKRGRFWLGYSFEQTLWQDRTDPTKAWGLFGQVGLSDGNPNSYRWQAVVGIGGSSPIRGRQNDRFGAGFFYYGYSGDLKRLLEPLITLRDEYGGEVFYNLALAPWLKVTGDAQLISPAIRSWADTPPIRNTAIMSNSTVVLLGLRLQIVF